MPMDIIEWNNLEGEIVLKHSRSDLKAFEAFAGDLRASYVVCNGGV